jgi:hypothetical protein
MALTSRTRCPEHPSGMMWLSVMMNIVDYRVMDVIQDELLRMTRDVCRG